MKRAVTIADAGIHGSRVAVVQRDVGLAVAIEIAGFDEVIAGTPEQRLETEGSVAVAEADISQGSLRIVHHQIGFAVAVKIAGAQSVEARSEELGTYS